MEKLVIGIVGKNGSGKDSVADFLVDNYGARKLVFSDMLKEALSIFIDDNEIGRLDMSWLSTNLRDKYGEGVLARGMKRRVSSSKEEILVISGVRDFGELEMIRSFQKNIFIAVKADPEIRWQRMTSRQIKADDKVSFEDFLDREELESEKRIEDLCFSVDYTINNDGEKDSLFVEVDRMLTDYLKKKF
ncbi:MAG: AAA family ATPase [Candidatus Pacebacteria bacterium]|nr:AAA family ATPase [Candidatus Paceibacterota bacterium]